MANTTDNKQEKIIEKIKKVLELSRNNPSEEEAKAAALKAQELMAQYHISMAEVDEVQDIENIVEEKVVVGGGKKWKYKLAGIIARNFRCRHFYYGRSIVVFYGYETDAKIAAETFKYLFKVGNTASDTYYNQLYWKAHNAGEYFNGKGIVNNFLVGYTNGISSALDKQCTALMIVTPKEVNEGCDKRLESCKKSIDISLNLNSWYGHEARQAGFEKGKSAIESKQIAEKVS